MTTLHQPKSLLPPIDSMQCPTYILTLSGRGSAPAADCHIGITFIPDEASMTLRTTPLHQAHLAVQARMVDFGGWEMPVHYGSQIKEHHAVRADAGMFDVSHMCVLDIVGPEAQPFLRGLLANNIDKLHSPGSALYSCMLNPEGGVLDDLIVYFFRADWYRLIVNAATAESDIAWITARNLATHSGLHITAHRSGPDAMALIAVQGPNARAKVWQVLPETQAVSAPLKPFQAVIIPHRRYGDLMLARTGYTGEDGFELGLPAQHAAALWQALLAAGVQPAGLGARDTLRLEAGMNLYGQDMDDSVNPLDAGLGWTVDLRSERDFMGKAALLKLKQRSQLVGLMLRAQGGVLRAHQTVATSAGAGFITSGTFSPTMQRTIALARLPLEVAPGATVHVTLREQQLAASVVALPFVRHGKILVT